MASPKFSYKVSASLVGQEELLQALLKRSSPEAKQDLHEWYCRRVLRTAKQLAPRETGEMEKAITVFYKGHLPVGVGVPATSPVIDRARATEYGSWNYSVGVPGAPKQDWPAKSKPTAAMPWLRTSALIHHYPFMRRIRRYFLTGKRDYST